MKGIWTNVVILMSAMTVAIVFIAAGEENEGDGQGGGGLEGWDVMPYPERTSNTWQRLPLVRFDSWDPATGTLKLSAENGAQDPGCAREVALEHGDCDCKGSLSYTSPDASDHHGVAELPSTLAASDGGRKGVHGAVDMIDHDALRPRGQYIEVISVSSQRSVRADLCEPRASAPTTYTVSGLVAQKGDVFYALVRRQCGEIIGICTYEYVVGGGSSLAPFVTFGQRERSLPSECCAYDRTKPVPLAFACWHMASGAEIRLGLHNGMNSAYRSIGAGSAGNSSALYTMDMSALPAGDYLLTLQLDSGPVDSLRFVTN